MEEEKKKKCLGVFGQQTESFLQGQTSGNLSSDFMQCSVLESLFEDMLYKRLHHVTCTVSFSAVINSTQSYCHPTCSSRV